MYDRLTKSDIAKMENEIYERKVKREELNRLVKEAKAQGDLSENFEYYAAKKDRNANESRIRYLENMVRTAKIIEDDTTADQVGLNNHVRMLVVEDEEEMEITLVTTILVNVNEDRFSIDSPIGKAIKGLHVGEEAWVELPDGGGYTVRILEITPVDGEKFDIQKF